MSNEAMNLPEVMNLREVKSQCFLPFRFFWISGKLEAKFKPCKIF